MPSPRPKERGRGRLLSGGMELLTPPPPPSLKKQTKKQQFSGRKLEYISVWDVIII